MADPAPASADAAFLGVSQSLSGRRWVGPDDMAARAALALAQRTGQPPALCAVLARRDVAPEDAAAFLDPRLKDLLPDPLVLKDMGAAAERVVAAARGRQRVAVFADYDVDGGASAALLLRWLRGLGVAATLYVPDRIDEGYGPNAPAMAALAAAHDLIVCVDCGTLSHEPVAAAAGADVVVLDHHLGGETLPPALAVVNPNRADEDGALGHLCAAGVVFLMLVEANRQLRAAGVAGPDLMALLDLVALATVADVAPLVGVNRALVRQGLKVMARRGNVGLVALADSARLDVAPGAYHLGYVLGPRINAGGRIGAADLGARLLATDDPAEAAGLAARLEQLNTDRREVEAAVRAAAMAQAEARGLDAPLVWAAGDGWHPGVVGIVAARLKEATNRPAVVIGFDGADGKGSGRSVTGIDLGASVHRLAAEGLIEKGGGHRMAAGLSLHRDGLEAAMARLSELMARQGAGALGPRDLRLDGVLMPAGATPELVTALETAGPYGAAAPAPRFALPDMLVRAARRVGETHLKLTLASGGGSLDAIAFGAFDGPMGAALEARIGGTVHAAGRLELNTWGGRTRVQLRLEDAALP
ncbi:single-stranded-DNA-specific exonuclease RecJ [Meridianimarinicoccus roseus]|uniref:Single-stranded-DNA-specific exonuclease RecJ n=1 Tax=Meridianimarinicoccus roseus TaxID=2072018 RepID=A0A2V2LJ46_9RHOB|nr:single-stranded-DNA-specific exonuclease RecJ [Meridianimarinicoccus roseus]PWR03167.1 single-stranded-DNA-specific exonuclease RecJ [Meridianimarinicoccus roseus]